MDRYDFPYRPDMQQGEFGQKVESLRGRGSSMLAPGVKVAVATCVVAVLASFGVGAKIGILLERTQAGMGCEPH
jgi:hypothetical protein